MGFGQGELFQKHASTGKGRQIPGQARLMRFLLAKYSDLINDFEKKTIGEIKALVDKEDLSIQSLAGELLKETPLSQTDLLASAKSAFEFVQSEFTFVKLDIDISFWLSPREILTEKIGDDKDLSIFLCSLLSVFGDNHAEVVVAELDGGQSHAFIMTELSGKFFILDPSQDHGFFDFSGGKSSALSKYSFEGAKIVRFLYRFNRQNYEQFI